MAEERSASRVDSPALGAEAESLEGVVPLDWTVSGADGYPLAGVHYPATCDARSAIVAIHGIQSHAGWYGRGCRWLAEAGHDVFFIDRRGSGRNRRDRGHCAGARQLCDDLVRSVEDVRKRRPGTPIVLLAISWGGKLAVATLKQRPDLVDALVLLTPGWFAKVAPSLRAKLAIGWSALLRPRRLFPIPLSDPALFTATPDRQQFLRQDADSLRMGTARLLLASRVLDAMISGAEREIRVPSLLMLAGRDRIIDNAKVRAYFERFASSRRTVLEFRQAHHTLEFEPDPKPIFDDLISWLNATLAGSET